MSEVTAFTDPGYEKLYSVLGDAIEQAANGKGKERHAVGSMPFHEQPICSIARMVGPGYQLGQAMKKAQEASRLPNRRARAELLGAINYLAAAVILLDEEHGEDQKEAEHTCSNPSPKQRHFQPEDMKETYKNSNMFSVDVMLAGTLYISAANEEEASSKANSSAGYMDALFTGYKDHTLPNDVNLSPAMTSYGPWVREGVS